MTSSATPLQSATASALAYPTATSWTTATGSHPAVGVRQQRADRNHGRERLSTGHADGVHVEQCERDADGHRKRAGHGYVERGDFSHDDCDTVVERDCDFATVFDRRSHCVHFGKHIDDDLGERCRGYSDTERRQRQQLALALDHDLCAALRHDLALHCRYRIDLPHGVHERAAHDQRLRDGVGLAVRIIHGDALPCGDCDVVSLGGAEPLGDCDSDIVCLGLGVC